MKNDHMPLNELVKLFLSFFTDRDFLIPFAYGIGIYILVYIWGIFL